MRKETDHTEHIDDERQKNHRLINTMEKWLTFHVQSKTENITKILA